MTILEAYLLLTLIYGTALAVICLTLYWVGKHCYLFQISKEEGHSFIQKANRYRMIRNKKGTAYYPMYDLFRRRPFKPEYELRPYMILTEGIPFIGIKYTLKMKIFNNRLHIWRPNKVDTTPEISYIMMSFTDKTRDELYESTKMELSKAELIAKIVLPMGIIILAVCCLIFFPRIYDSIMDTGNRAVTSAIDQFGGYLDRIRPPG